MCLLLFYLNKNKTRFQFYDGLLKILYNDWKLKVHWHHNFSIIPQGTVLEGSTLPKCLHLTKFKKKFRIVL